ncbi:MAG: hypothetical protein LBU00_08225 [Treponema sp.]|jgi:hypothetical protein|nr:hypothetical protein [Treponema sp.]
MNLLSTVSAGVWFSVMKDVGPFGVGGKIGYSMNIPGIITVELSALDRWYFFSSTKYRIFAQIELGTALIFYEEQIHPAIGGRTYPSFSGGLDLGMRIPIGSWWYIEPTLRGGYPYLWGAGILFGGRI